MENLPERQNPHAHLRASDEDRDRVVEVLRDSLMAGRLTQDEHAERLEQTLNARTLGELEPITQDLCGPRSGRGAVGRRPEGGRRTDRGAGEPRGQLRHGDRHLRRR